MKIKLIMPTSDCGIGKMIIRFGSLSILLVKILLNQLSKQNEKTMGLIKKADKKILLILQPVTTKQGGISPAAGDKISEYLRLAGRDLENVRIIPQMHRVMRIK